MQSTLKQNLHQRYMARYEYIMMLLSYEDNCKELGSYYIDPESKKEPYKYNLDKAAERIIRRNRNYDKENND